MSKLFISNRAKALLNVKVITSRRDKGQGVSGSIPGSSKVLLGFYRIFENFSVVARSQAHHLLHGTYKIVKFEGTLTLCAYPFRD
ncbi:hypothetical protein SFRURICE_007712 [Spodoptera frugiperda]|nr:hypothetical protein SFRURICE_007712 [Spodoptera frugiperda]